MENRVLTKVLRTVFNLLYHQFAWTYDWISHLVSAGNWLSWVQSASHYLDGPMVLELGMGPGHLQVTLNQTGITTFGLDESRQMVRAAYRRLIRYSNYPKLVRGDAQRLPYKGDSFDQVVMTFPAEFILKQITWLEIRRVLQVGGEVLVIPIAWITGQKPVERIVAWFNHVTGEAPTWSEKFLDQFKNLGFELHWEFINLPSSKLLLIRLIKTRE